MSEALQQSVSEDLEEPVSEGLEEPVSEDLEKQAAALKQKAAVLGQQAAALDDADELRSRRALFQLGDLDEDVYLDGNSLGALPAHVPARIADVIQRQWGELRIRSWDESGWWSAPQRVGDRIAPLVGAAPGRVVVGDSTSVNVFKAVVAGARLNPGRTEIVVDSTTFPTDGYIAASAARLTGCGIVPVEPGELASVLGPATAVVLLNHVDFRTGRLHDLPSLTAQIQDAGALAVWDLCHSAGALPVGLDAHRVDLAVGCTYKYLNGGPGSPAYLYVAERHQHAFDSPLPGWNSHADPFAMAPDHTPAEGVARGRVGTPAILSLLALEAALDVWDGVSIDSVRAKSLALTDFFLECADSYVTGGVSGPGSPVSLLTPLAHGERGSQLALRCANAPVVMERLIARGVVGDLRRPDVLRFGFTPLYTGFADVERAAAELARVLAEVAGELPA